MQLYWCFVPSHLGILYVVWISSLMYHLVVGGVLVQASLDHNSIPYLLGMLLCRYPFCVQSSIMTIWIAYPSCVLSFFSESC